MIKNHKTGRLLVAAVLVATTLPARTQTGQALLGNPLLSPEKIKEVRRQIAEAAHPTMPVQAQLPAALLSPPPPPPMPVENIAPQRQINASGDLARLAMARLQVMTVVGKSAVLAMQSSPANDSMQMPPGPALMPMMQQPGLPNLQTQQASSAIPAQQYARRSASTTIRDREPTYIEGYDVIPIVNGDMVRLVLASAPNTTIFQGTIQPALRTPTFALAATATEKTSNEYIQGTSPDATSMTPSAASSPAPQLAPNAPLMQQPRLPGSN
jgi:hypothetical protein